MAQDQAYTNRFVDVHEKVRAFKDRVREARSGDAELRENKAVAEAQETPDKEAK